MVHLFWARILFSFGWSRSIIFWFLSPSDWADRSYCYSLWAHRIPLIVAINYSLRRCDYQVFWFACIIQIGDQLRIEIGYSEVNLGCCWNLLLLNSWKFLARNLLLVQVEFDFEFLPDLFDRHLPVQYFSSNLLPHSPDNFRCHCLPDWFNYFTQLL